MTPVTDIYGRAIELIEQLASEQLSAIAGSLEFLAKPSEQGVSNQKKIALLEVIQRHFPSEQQRLEELHVSEAFRRKHWEYGELADSEHEKLG